MHYRPYKQPNDGWMFAAIWITLGAICILCVIRSASMNKMMRSEHERTIHQYSEGEK